MKNSTQLLAKRGIESIVAYAIISMLRNFLIISPNSLIFRQMLGKRVIITHHQDWTIALPLLCKSIQFSELRNLAKLLSTSSWFSSTDI